MRIYDSKMQISYAHCVLRIIEGTLCEFILIEHASVSVLIRGAIDQMLTVD